MSMLTHRCKVEPTDHGRMTQRHIWALGLRPQSRMISADRVRETLSTLHPICRLPLPFACDLVPVLLGPDKDPTLCKVVVGGVGLTKSGARTTLQPAIG
jgi:hypothetical protein